jgi:hypothetical protein
MEKRATSSGRRIEVIPEDRERINHTAEKILHNLEEVASIIAKSLGKEAKDIGGLNLSISGLQIRVGFPKTHGIHARNIWPYPGNPNGCYEDPPGICFECSIEGF